VIQKAEAEQELVPAGENTDLNRSMETVAAWLDRISRKDPALFWRLRNHLKGARV
jgi:hypothetical protein